MNEVTRYAVVRRSGITVDEVQAYLPRGYKAQESAGEDEVLISGRDNAGWTLDGYVIPRLQSGMFGVRELAAKED